MVLAMSLAPVKSSATTPRRTALAGMMKKPDGTRSATLKRFQEKCEAVFRPEERQDQ
jgi:hypothetical protein